MLISYTLRLRLIQSDDPIGPTGCEHHVVRMECQGSGRSVERCCGRMRQAGGEAESSQRRYSGVSIVDRYRIDRERVRAPCA
jgi:hypothetical protein